jgi:hypothetical protein
VSRRGNFKSIKNRPTETTVRDALGRPLAEGDTVIIPSRTGQCLWQIAQIVPELQPTLPPGTLRVVLRTQSVQLMPAGEQTEMVLVVPAEPAPEVDVDENQNGKATITLVEE